MDCKQLESENKQLKEYIETLKMSNIQKMATISKLNSIGVSLATQKDVSSILKNILLNVKEFTNADGGTIYIAYGDKLTFKHILNDTLNIVQNDSEEPDDVWNYLTINEENQNMVAIRCALTKQIINIDDVYDSTRFDFSGTKKFDSKTGYRSKSMLVIPMIGDDNSLVGVLQLINKIDLFTKEILAFSKEDENLAHSLASQASVAVQKFRQDKLIMQQSKMAAMGEMIDAIAHQWKQPLNVISIGASELEMNLNFGFDIDNEMLANLAKETQNQVAHLLSTLEEFRSFLRPDKPKEKINISSLLRSVLVLLKDDLTSNNIETEIRGNLNLEFNVIVNEVKHIFINLLSNARDAFKDNNIKNRKVVFEILEKKGYVSVEVTDNAGGIPIHVIDDIFKANVTTKEEGKGTGIGLYMATQIAQKNNGELSVENVEGGAKFTLNIVNT
ncbi:MAG: GAF domain-containing sensor histidine kinase [Campylobacterales bacterium]|nr:GAF domain-containing sensor histidine kinase [Campylobacterales bacterium]